MRSGFQTLVAEWMRKTFGQRMVSKPRVGTEVDVVKAFEGEIQEAYTSKTRAFRFLEEAIELCQAEGMTMVDCMRVNAYVFDRERGKINQEVGGVMVTLAAYCESRNLDMQVEGLRELFRIDTPEMMEKIRKKQEEKPNGLPAPKERMEECLCGPGEHCDVCMPF